MLGAIKSLIGVPNSLVIFAVGIHEHFNHDLISKRVLSPIFKLLSNNTWPKIIWPGYHLTGLLKSPSYTKQQPDSIRRYNAKIKATMDQHKIPVLDFANASLGIVSYDGTHFGKGLNDVKANVILHYILNQRKSEQCVV